MIEITIDVRTPLLNEWQRMHWARRRRLAKDIAWRVKLRLPIGQHPDRPLKRCSIEIERESTQAPDIDGMVGGLKPLLDALQPHSRRHPHGLGIIADDSPKCVTGLSVRHVAGKGQRTTIRIHPEG